MLALGYAFGLRDLELFLLVAIYGTPVAAASYPMAQNMGGDGELAGQFVVISTVVARWDPVWVDLLYEERGTDLVHLLQYDIFDPASVQDEGAVFRPHVHRKIRAEAEDVFSGCVPVKL